MSIPIPTSTAAAVFAQIIEGLRHTVPKFIAQDRTAGPLIILIWTHLGRLGRRFAAIAARAEAGTLPAPRRRRPVARRTGTVRAPSPLPTGFAWLGQMMWETRASGHHLHHLVTTDPQMMALMAASPQAARIVRSIFWMTCIRPVPACVRAPRRSVVPASPNPVEKTLAGRSTPASIPPPEGGRGIRPFPPCGRFGSGPSPGASCGPPPGRPGRVDPWGETQNP